MDDFNTSRNPRHRGPHKVEHGGEVWLEKHPPKTNMTMENHRFLTGDTSSFMVVFLLSFMVVFGGVAIIHLKLQDGWPF